MDGFLIHIMKAKKRIYPEYFLLRLLEASLKLFPIFVSVTQLDRVDSGSLLTNLLWCIDRYYHCWIQLHILDVFELLFSLGIAFENKSLHSAVFLEYPFFNELFNEEVVN
jgi:hypothetical protein